MTVLSKLAASSHRNALTVGSSSVLISVVAALLVRQAGRFQRKRSVQSKTFTPPARIPDRVFDTHASAFPTIPVPAAKQRVAVDREFFRQLKALFLILVPRIRSKEVLIILLHSAFLVLRTWLSVVVAKLDGSIVRSIVSADGKSFMRGLGWWFAIAVPAVYTNSMIRYLQSKLSIAFRTRLTRYAHDLYLDKSISYYRIGNLDGRVEDADQYITTDVARFCDNLASLYSNMGKPILDMLIFNYQLIQGIGFYGTVGMFINYLITARIIRAATPPFGKLAAIEAKLEGDYRSAHSRLITNAEEIAFYNGADLEKSILKRTYTRLIRHINHVFKIRIAYNMFEDFVIKYCWSAFGLCINALPVFYPEWAGRGGKSEVSARGAGATTEDDGKRAGSRTQGFITNKRLMTSLADAGGRILYSYKELAELAGRTSRVYNLISVLHALRRGESSYVDGRANGQVLSGNDLLRFDQVPVIAPTARDGDLLVSDMTFEVHPGDHLLITGPNGVGKTGIARIISGLWPAYRGILERPAANDIFYVPQRPYLSLGSLRLLDILRIVHLAYIPSREGGWETIKDWKDVFSGGEKQRMNMARVFYHHPKFAILDECTSAVSADVEGLMYNDAKDRGITLVTISHRPSLFKYHKYLLRLTGDTDGSWTYEQIGTKQELMSVEHEIEELERQLADVSSLRDRIADINHELELGENSGIHSGARGGGGRLADEEGASAAKKDSSDDSKEKSGTSDNSHSSSSVSTTTTKTQDGKTITVETITTEEIIEEHELTAEEAAALKTADTTSSSAKTATANKRQGKKK
ncbi:ABC transporter transmembrane region 2-domain-containing protein [Syncephalis fuscata]|nr:ABC transporter transmembrane region 2-domain-containing protein [Syncephalis fuscata]